jgi:integrase
MATVIRKRECSCTDRTRCGHRPWAVRYRADGKQVEESFKTKGQARARAVAVEHVKNEGSTPIRARDGGQAFGAYAATWIAQHHGAEATKRTYASCLSKHLQPVLGDVPLSRITREQVRRLLLETMPATPVGPGVIMCARTLIVAVLGEAARSKKVSENVASSIRLPAMPSERAEFTMATWAQLDQIGRGLPTGWALAVVLMRGCGLRIGEALAVRSDSVRGDVLRIEEQVLSTGKLGPLKHRKPGEYRDMPLPKYVARAITEHGGSGYLLPQFADGTVRPYRLRAAFLKQRTAAGLPASFTPHDLRHCYASACLAGGVPITDLSRWLGHRDINLTHRVYGHMVPSAVGAAIEILDKDWSQQAAA